ncbi:MAG: PIN domain-containing protein [Propionibacteriaceae bacterium]|nr:PIN domain-containing protein [Propionibacteriaceae bacterium]
MSASVDTNILLRLIRADVPDQHAVACRLLNDPARPVAVDDQALIETVFALNRYYQVSRSDCARVVGAVLEMPTLIGNFAVFRSAMNLWAAHPKLSLSDCYLAEKAADAQMTPLWTFDQKLANQHTAAQLAS